MTLVRYLGQHGHRSVAGAAALKINRIGLAVDDGIVRHAEMTRKTEPQSTPRRSRRNQMRLPAFAPVVALCAGRRC
jgi:hypothetical protein